MIPLFDSHAHYTDDRFDEDRYELIDNLYANGVVGIINVASYLGEVQACIDMAKRYPLMWATAGVHPQVADRWNEGSEAELRAFLKEEKCVALGEIGLDYVVGDVPKDLQKEVFLKQLQIAKDTDTPVIIHDREAHKDTIDMLKASGCRGVVHCFSGSAEMAAELVKDGWYISFPGVVTFKNARRSLEAAAVVPLDKILIETDAPYLAPVPYRGKRNDSLKMEGTCRCLAEFLQIDPIRFGEITAENARACFGL